MQRFLTLLLSARAAAAEEEWEIDSHTQLQPTLDSCTGRPLVYCGGFHLTEAAEKEQN